MEGEGTVEISAKAVVLATGLDPIDVGMIPEFGHGRYPDVITSLELEEMFKDFDPVGVRRPSDGKVPKNVVFIQCVGSRVETRGVSYCSTICCLNAIKNATLIRKALPQVQCYRPLHRRPHPWARLRAGVQGGQGERRPIHPGSTLSRPGHA